MQEVFEKIKQKLEEKVEITWEHDYRGGRSDAFFEACNIVEKIEKEYNNGWIPCSERLPDKIGNYIVCNNHSEIWVANWFNDTWWGIEKRCRWDGVIAWQPLLAPYEKEV